MNLSANTFLIFGANTDVGKTCFSAALAFAAKQQCVSFCYVKPLQTGVSSREHSDAATIARCAAQDAIIETLFSWEPATSPHLASGGTTPSATVFDRLTQFLSGSSKSLTLIETAGGPASPSTDHVLQAELYRSLQIPAILIGDSRLGGISATITAHSYLSLCGYTISGICMFDDELQNHQAIQAALPDSMVIVVPKISSEQSLVDWCELASNPLRAWFQSLVMFKQTQCASQTQRLQAAAQKLWWPFTQHRQADARFIEAAQGDHFYTSEGRQFDAISSWWTMGLPHGDFALASAVGHAAARYGHVLFPEHVHAPALDLAEQLLASAGKAWAQRVFYTDNGSTAVEAALKMAFRYRETFAKSRRDWLVVGLVDSYHGDTLGAMDASSPNAFKDSEPWYKPRGIWIHPPTISYQNGVLACDQYPQQTFSCLKEVFDTSRRRSSLATEYLKTIQATLNERVDQCGALLIEPIVHGSGGMELIDPLFQTMLILWCREHKIPVVFDEVFVGLWRLGVPSASELLGETPDIACYAKLLTGGVLPLAATLTSPSVFQSFLGDSKAQALLHGHSYTAHPVGCAAGAHAMRRYQATFQTNRVADYWDEGQAARLSQCAYVKRVTVIGSVCAVEFKSQSNAQQGYLSDAMQEFVKYARKQGVTFRPLGNVIYFVVSPLKTSRECLQLFEGFVDLCAKFFV